MITPQTENEILSKILGSSKRGFELRQEAMELLDTLPDYNWSGIYRLEGEKLLLDAYVGEPTDHTEIPVGRGVCGTAVAEDKNQVIEDVRELTNYLSCSVKTRSEIVVLIRDSEGKILGQIDIDGHRVGAFDKSDEAFLEKMAEILAQRWE
jgi:L-methionine (R)-S-oxide reductase